MANSTCVHCQSTKFEIKSGTITNPVNRLPIKVYFIQCAKCGGVIGVFNTDPTTQNSNLEE